jgi:hypothetical protein
MPKHAWCDGDGHVREIVAWHEALHHTLFVNTVFCAAPWHFLRRARDAIHCVILPSGARIVRHSEDDNSLRLHAFKTMQMERNGKDATPVWDYCTSNHQSDNRCKVVEFLS